MARELAHAWARSGHRIESPISRRLFYAGCAAEREQAPSSQVNQAKLVLRLQISARQPIHLP
ncbi:hypothetical protein EMIT0P100_40170 [Pseudomonas sp. IT-P100]